MSQNSGSEGKRGGSKTWSSYQVFYPYGSVVTNSLVNHLWGQGGGGGRNLESVFLALS